MGAHGRGQDFWRQVHERLVDGPHQRHRPFDKPRHLGQQAGIVAQHQPRFLGQFLRLVFDDGGAQP